jgi:hypothetical protein
MHGSMYIKCIINHLVSVFKDNMMMAYHNINRLS